MSFLTFRSEVISEKKNKMKKLINIDPWFITGFTDAEGCFLLSVARYKEYRLGWRVILRFQISLPRSYKRIKHY
jgi:hypothetical protein